MKAIVVGYDGSECAKRALERAAGLCTSGEVLHVVAAEPLMPQGKGSVTAVDPIEVEECKRALNEAGTMLSERHITAKLVEVHGTLPRHWSTRPKQQTPSCSSSAHTDGAQSGDHCSGRSARTSYITRPVTCSSYGSGTRAKGRSGRPRARLVRSELRGLGRQRRRVYRQPRASDYRWLAHVAC